MYGLVSQRLNEAGGAVYYPTAEIIAALNEANRLFVLLTLGLETTVTWSVPQATTSFHMLQTYADWLVPLRIQNATGQKIRPMRLDDLAALDSNWPNSPGTPYRYSHVGVDVLSIYHQPATIGTNLTVTYARAPVDLVLDADVPEIPATYHPDLVDYAINRMRMPEGGQEFAKTLPLLDNFLKGAAKYADFVRSRNRGSQYDKDPFELESFDRSKLLKLRTDLVPSRKVSQ